MKKQIVALLAGAILMMATSAMALTINLGTTDVGDLDYLMAYTVLDDSSPATENTWAAPIVLTEDGNVVTFDVQTSSTESNWKTTDQEGVYAFALSGLQDYFIIKTGSLYVGNPSGQPPLASQYEHFLYRNNAQDSWAVIDLFELYGDNYLEYLDSFQVNEGKISHVTTEGGNIPVPEPTTMLLLGSGLLGLAWYGRKRKQV